MNQITVKQADLSITQHQDATVELMDAYSLDPMGDGKPLSPEVRTNLISGLQQHPTTLIFLAFIHGKGVGIAICFRGFSTFAARPLINISDFYVVPEFRGQGIGELLLKAVEQTARDTGCCKLTLEVQENNHRARHIYETAGFSRAVHVEAAGGALFLTKAIILELLT